MNSFSRLQRPKAKKSSRTLSLDVNSGGLYISLNSCPIIGMMIHLTYTLLLIRFTHIPLNIDKVPQECLRNSVIACLSRKRVLDINYQSQPRPPFWVIL